MEVFTMTRTVEETDLDERRHVNNVRYVQWIQDISEAHWNHVAPETLRKDLVWVVRNHNISYHKAAFLGDPILMKTYIAGNKGPLSQRIVEIYHADNGDLLVQSTTSWCLLDANTLRPMGISEEIRSLFPVAGASG